MRHQFDNEELLTIFEAARVALADADVFDMLAECMCLSDQVLLDLRDKLDAFMDTELPTSVTCSICKKQCSDEYAHQHQGEWIGDKCCWTESLRCSE